MSDFLKFMLIVGPVGIFTYVVGHIVGWWSGYRTAIDEWKQPDEQGDWVEARHHQLDQNTGRVVTTPLRIHRGPRLPRHL